MSQACLGGPLTRAKVRLGSRRILPRPTRSGGAVQSTDSRCFLTLPAISFIWSSLTLSRSATPR